MPTLNVVAELTIEDIMTAVSQLNEAELVEFEIQFEQLWLARMEAADKEAAQIASLYRLPPAQQARLRSLLQKNREEGVTQRETEELDQYMDQLDQALDKTAAELLKLARKREQEQTGKTS